MTVQRVILKLLGIGCFALALGAVPSPGESDSGKKVKAVLADLPNAGEKEAKEIVSKVIEDRMQIQSQLILQLAAPKSKHHQIVVVYLLGFYRMSGATRDLAKVITLESEDYLKQQTRLPLWGRYPAAGALIKIGMPSIPVAMERLETAETELVVELGTMVIDKILGRELGEMAIKQAIDKQPNPKKRKKLEESLVFFKTKLSR